MRQTASITRSSVSTRVPSTDGLRRRGVVALPLQPTLVCVRHDLEMGLVATVVDAEPHVQIGLADRQALGLWPQSSGTTPWRAGRGRRDAAAEGSSPKADPLGIEAVSFDRFGGAG